MDQLFFFHGSPEIFKNILVVCVGNICRSPTAERILRQKLSGKFISSAGLGALKNKGIDPSAAAMLIENKYDAADHSARQISSSMLVEADLVLVMEKAHQQSLMDRYPAHSGKVMLLGHWSGQEIDDPYRKSDEAFRFIFEQIEESCSEWVTRIGG